MKRMLLLLFAALLWQTDSFAQSSAIVTSAAEIIQQSQSTGEVSAPAPAAVSEVMLAAGTPIEVEVALHRQLKRREIRRANQLSRFDSHRRRGRYGD